MCVSKAWIQKKQNIWSFEHNKMIAYNDSLLQTNKQEYDVEGGFKRR